MKTPWNFNDVYESNFLSFMWAATPTIIFAMGGWPDNFFSLEAFLAIYGPLAFTLIFTVCGILRNGYTEN